VKVHSDIWKTILWMNHFLVDSLENIDVPAFIGGVAGVFLGYLAVLLVATSPILPAIAFAFALLSFKAWLFVKALRLFDWWNNNQGAVLNVDLIGDVWPAGPPGGQNDKF
jgi:hypothetical protein